MNTRFVLIIALILISSVCFAANHNYEMPIPLYNCLISSHANDSSSIKLTDSNPGVSFDLTYTGLSSFTYNALGITGTTVVPFANEYYNNQVGGGPRGHVYMYIEGNVANRVINLPSAANDQDSHSVGMFAWYGKMNRGFPQYEQTDPQWGDDSYGDGSTTIYNAGCNMCCTAMQLTQQGFVIDPHTLNYELQHISAYTKGKVRGYNGRSVNWSGVLAVCKKFGYNFVFKHNLGMPTILNRNLPGQFSVKNERHWVIGVANLNNARTYLIHDPFGRTDDSSSYAGVDPLNTRTYYLAGAPLAANVAPGSNGVTPSTGGVHVASVSILPIIPVVPQSGGLDWGQSSITVWLNSYVNNGNSMNLTLKKFVNPVCSSILVPVASDNTEYAETPDGKMIEMGTQLEYTDAPDGIYEIQLTNPNIKYSITVSETDYYGNVSERTFNGIGKTATFCFRHLTAGRDPNAPVM